MQLYSKMSIDKRSKKKIEMKKCWLSEDDVDALNSQTANSGIIYVKCKEQPKQEPKQEPKEEIKKDNQEK